MSGKMLIDAVASEIIVCEKCPLSKSRKNAVPGVGSQNSKVMLIGEAPGASEDVKGEPFVGRAGKFLDKLLLMAGLSREKVFITNIVKCRPPGNREPKPLEIETCTAYLRRQILIIRPEFIITLGSHSTSHIFSVAEVPFSSITKARGRTYKASIWDREVTVFPMFHPASALYNPEYEELLVRDFQFLRTKLPRTIFKRKQPEMRPFEN